MMLMGSKILSSLKETCAIDRDINEDELLFKTKKKLLYQIIRITIIVGAVTVLIAFIESLVLKQGFLAYTYLLLYLPLIVILLNYQKITYKKSILGLLATTYLLGVVNLFTYSISGAAIPIFMMMLILAVIFMGLRAGLASLCLCIFSMMVFCWLFAGGIISLRVDLKDISYSVISWITAMSVLGFLGIIAMLSFSIIENKMFKSHQKTILQSQELNKLSERLRRELKISYIAEQKLQAGNARFQDVVSNISTVIWKADVNEKGELANYYVSEAADRILGLPAGTVGNDLEYFIGSTDSEYERQLLYNIRQVIKNPGRLYTFEYIVNKAGGGRFWLQFRMKCYKRNDELIIFGTISDISKRKAVELELREMKENLEKMVAQRTEELEEQKQLLVERNRVFIGREFRIKELRDELKELKKKQSETQL